jgi:GT2 family glycosyltransferase
MCGRFRGVGGMIVRRLQALHARYAASRLVVRGGPVTLHDGAGKHIGYVDRIEMRGGRLRVAGWASAARVRLVLADVAADMAPRLRREDVAAARNIAPEVGFDLTLPCTPTTVSGSDAPGLILEALPGTPDIPPHSLPLSGIRRARALLALRFGWALALLVPAIIGWYATRNPRYRARIKAGLGLNAVTTAQALEPRLFLTGDADMDRVRPATPCTVTIVLPVYNAFDLLEKVLTRIERHTDLPWRLILIEDCSSDARVRPFLRDWVGARDRRDRDVHLIENAENRGFIASVNDGLARAMGFEGADEGPVILFNSDAFVPAGWASRMVAPMQNHENVASVTPMSNDAEIFSTPAICAKTPLVQGQVDVIDAVAQTFHPEALLSEAPTGVGFCMALSRDWLARVPALDTAFGRGYGEEVDWCQKVRALGGRHLGLPGLFVEHRGGESFGSEAKQALVARNNDIVARRYPAYDNEVQGFIGTDPMVTARLALGLAWAGSIDPDRQVPVYVAHSLGGGAENYLTDQVAGACAAGQPVVILRVGGTRRWQIELHAPAGTVQGSTDDTGFMHRLLDILPRRRLIYSCGVGDPDPMGLPGTLLDLCARPGDAADMLFHDFFPLSPSYTLLDSDGVYRGPLTGGRTDAAHQTFHADGRPAPLTDWQAAWKALAKRCDTLQVFSKDSARQVRTVWPDLAPRIRVSPHTLPQTPPRLEVAVDARPVIGVLGNIGFQKGAAVLQDLAALLEQEGQARMVLIGNIDPGYGLPGSVPVHGSYILDDLPALAARYGVTHWLIPSVWPETFSYTTREALATGLPVLAFDIGAQGEAVRAAPGGVVMPFPAGPPRPVAPGTRIRGEAGIAARNVIEALNATASPDADAATQTTTRTPT